MNEVWNTCVTYDDWSTGAIRNSDFIKADHIMDARQYCLFIRKVVPGCLVDKEARLLIQEKSIDKS